MHDKIVQVLDEVRKSTLPYVQASSPLPEAGGHPVLPITRRWQAHGGADCCRGH